MIDDLKPYSETKDSGAEWLGQVPEHWEVRRIKTLLREKDERSGHGTGLLLSLTRARGLIPQSEASNRLASAEDLSKYKVCKPGDLVMNRMQAWSGMFAVASLEGLVSPDYSVFEAINPCEIHYFEHLFKTPVVVDQFAQASKGIGSGFNRLYTPEFGAIPISVPPRVEQSLIARYLDNLDRRVRRLIRTKRKLIALLNEQKQVNIHRAVTRGLDPNDSLKDSGVEWLGEVPTHWQVRSLTRSIVDRADYRGATPEKVETGITLVTAKNIRKGWIDYDVSREYVAKDRYSEIMRRGLPRCGDLLLTMEAPLGHAALVDDEHVAFAQRVVRFRMDPELFVSPFVLLSVLSQYVQDQLLSRGTGSTALGIKASKLPQIRILQPPLDEQEKILRHIDDATAPLDVTISRAKREIELLSEYRTRLVADVVTGKLDVRRAADALDQVAPFAAEDEANDLSETDADIELNELESQFEAAEI